MAFSKTLDRALNGLFRQRTSAGWAMSLLPPVTLEGGSHPPEGRRRRSLFRLMHSALKL